MTQDETQTTTPPGEAAAGDSPAAAQARADAYATPEGPLDRPEVQVLGAFVGAFVVAKLLKRLFGRD